jgi:Tfp pilus assembly protein PilF
MRRFATWACLLLLAVPVALPGQKEAKEPFYRRFLVPGDPLDDAIVSQERRIAEDPENAGLHNDMGVLLARRRFPEMAEDEFRLAMKLDKNNWLAPYNLGLVLESEEDWAGAKKAYRKSIDKNPGFPPSLFRLGLLYERGGERDAAIAQYAAALRIDPSMRNPEVNPLVVHSLLMDRAILTNYVYDTSRSRLPDDVVYTEPERFRPPQVDRPISTDEVIDPADPPTIPPIRFSTEATAPQVQAETPPVAVTPLPAASGAPAMLSSRPRTTRAPLSPDAFAGRPTPPPAAEPEPEEPEEVPEPEPTAGPNRN